MKFKHIGGGCDIITGKCDEEYENEEKTIKFKVLTDLTGHTFLPEEYKIEKVSEIKNFEGEQIRKAMKQNEI